MGNERVIMITGVEGMREEDVIAYITVLSGTLL
jgi:hypothetical protein